MKKLSLLLIAVMLTGCMQNEEVEEIVTNTPSYTEAVSIVYPVGDSGVNGTVYFMGSENGVMVEANITGLEPGNHGFHIHQFGDCTAEDGTSAGGHFNPNENMHAGPDAEDRHMGDMGNITANEDGVATIEYTDDTIRIDQIIGRGIIVHAGEDDLTSQPSGAAGPRLGCGVIGIQNQ